DQNNSYDCGVARSVTGSYKTVGTSFELGLLVDGSGVSTRAVLLDSIMHFFGCYVVGVEEGFVGLESGKSGMVLVPNPFHQKIDIRYRIQDTGLKNQGVNLAIYDVSGRVVRTFNLASGIQDQVSSVVWDGCDDLGRELPGGVYFVRLEAGGFKQVEKAVLLR
ncbi:MAG: T9SS type A sorting domain-containing protein, partial [candidate division WOR-3 bacterium]